MQEFKKELMLADDFVANPQFTKYLDELGIFKLPKLPKESSSSKKKKKRKMKTTKKMFQNNYYQLEYFQCLLLSIPAHAVTSSLPPLTEVNFMHSNQF